VTPDHRLHQGGNVEATAPGNVLVVDDDAAMRALVAHWLRHAGMTVLEAATGEAAMIIAGGHSPTMDAIVLDVMMPEMDGYEVIRRLKTDPRTSPIPIVFLSASAAEADIIRGVQAGATDYLSKPFSGPILVTKVGALIARARAERSLYDKLRVAEENAAMDALTNLANRRAFEQRLAEMIANSTRHREPLSLMMLDIDRFKAINDTFGHVAGDAALKHLADKLRGAARTGDQVFRYGGEEFGLLLHKCDRVGAVLVFERIRAALQNSPLEYEGVPLPFSVSGGIASLEASNRFRQTHLVRRADGALYEAKRNGRDRVVLEKLPDPSG
jgi:diguanylate cyclase (GGDEF)-like protein